MLNAYDKRDVLHTLRISLCGVDNPNILHGSLTLLKTVIRKNLKKMSVENPTTLKNSPSTVGFLATVVTSI